MARFFMAGTNIKGGMAIMTGRDAEHVRVLRLRPGEDMVICDGQGTDYKCRLLRADKNQVEAEVVEVSACPAEPTVKTTILCGLPKGDKTDYIIQKCVELGVTAIVPVAMSRCIVKLDGKDAAKKQARWQKIADEAAGQSGRGILPAVETPISWKQALSRWERENTLLCYEGGGEPIGRLVTPADTAVSLVVGPEGGFDPAEVEAVTAVGGRIATLGPRILRCETAPLAAIAVLMEKSGNME